MQPVITFLRCRQASDRESIFKAVSGLWENCFGDSSEYIWEFCQDLPLAGAVLASDKNAVVGMALLLQPDLEKSVYYGYAVCTHPDYRGRGICHALHEKIHGICSMDHAGYFVRPAERGLETLYEKMGLQTLLWEDERIVTTEDVISHALLSSDAYARIRQVYFASAGLCEWDAHAIEFMCRNGYNPVGFTLDGMECAAFLSEQERMVCELCAPKGLLDRAAVYAASALGGQAIVRFPAENCNGRSAIMGFDIAKDFYFNLYIE